MRDKVVRRVRWKVARAHNGGWLPTVLVGEQPIRFSVCACRAEARRIARKEAKILNAAKN
jgi:hypothetical protein